MSSCYHHLSYDERVQIEVMISVGLSLQKIAKRLGRSVSAISWELRRNHGGRSYNHEQAQGLSQKRRSEASSCCHKITAEALTRIESLLRSCQFSPEQIAGRLKMEGVVSISHTRIYQHIWQDREQGGDLYSHLRHHGKKYNRSGKGAGRGVIRSRIDIRERPEVVEEKSRIGDWEFDAMIGSKRCGVLMTLVERGSKFVLMQRVRRKTAQEVSAAIKKKLKRYKDWCLTLTADNGKEFADHEEVSKALRAGFYFAVAYHSWERGLSEHSNGLIRQYWPKGTDLSGLKDAEVQRVQDLLNNRPRKVLGFCMPQEVFEQVLENIGCSVQEAIVNVVSKVQRTG